MPEHGLRKNGATQEPPRHVSKAPKPRGTDGLAGITAVALVVNRIT